MTVCTRCHRPLKRQTETGMGPVCARASKVEPVPVHEPDLFGYDLDKAAHAARYRLQVQIEGDVAQAHIWVKQEFRAARVRLGLWG